jgi:adenine-specific DNA-methyltransferase
MKNKNQQCGDLGQHWTPVDVASTMISLMKNSGTILEPSAGSGRFVELLNFKKLTALEIDERVIPKHLMSKYIIDNFFNFPETKKFNTIIGNPPYVAGKLLTSDWFNNWKGILPRTANAYLHFIDKCINHLEQIKEIK